MDRILIKGGKPLEGAIPISGAKNAALPLMTASLLTDEPLMLSNLPHLADITTMAHLLQQHGTALEYVQGKSASSSLALTTKTIASSTAPYDLVRKMRASILVLGPLLARHGKAEVSLPGGCAIGTRPVDLHLRAMEELGAVITLEEGYIKATAPKGLCGGTILFPQVTVGGTENALMAAVLAKGTTVIRNAAREPEVADLAHCLVAMGAKVEGIGSDTLTIEGVSRLHGARHSVIPDRIEAGSYAVAAAVTRGLVRIEKLAPSHLNQILRTLVDVGVGVDVAETHVTVDARDCVLMGSDVMTEPYPGFPTDMQAQMMVLMATATGASMITESIFENRFMHVPELMRMGANVTVHGASAIVRGVPRLSGAPVMATDLRASMSLVLAGLAAEGETIVNRVYHLDRGYERLEEKLAACGASIERLKDGSA